MTAEECGGCHKFQVQRKLREVMGGFCWSRKNEHLQSL